MIFTSGMGLAKRWLMEKLLCLGFANMSMPAHTLQGSEVLEANPI